MLLTPRCVFNGKKCLCLGQQEFLCWKLRSVACCFPLTPTSLPGFWLPAAAAVWLQTHLLQTGPLGVQPCLRLVRVRVRFCAGSGHPSALAHLSAHPSPVLSSCSESWGGHLCFHSWTLNHVPEDSYLLGCLVKTQIGPNSLTKKETEGRDRETSSFWRSYQGGWITRWGGDKGVIARV